MSDAFPSPRIPGLRESVPGAAYKKGDIIGQKYEVYGLLGAGGFGIVYLVYSRETQNVYALKTFLDRFLADAQTRERFRKEAGVWVDLERHPYLVRAYFVEELSGRLFIGMEHIAPDEHGLNTMEGHLRHRPPDLTQSLRWAIQFCHGMEYAYSKGIRCHRDIKPANIMVGEDKTVKITDFGLAGVLGPAQAMSGIRSSVQQGAVGVSGQTMEGTGFGTPEYMPPEQFTDAASCDERSDIYSFGVVLFQMASGGRPPYAASARTFDAWFRVHSEGALPVLQSPLAPLVARCLQKRQGARYGSFHELRMDLDDLLDRTSGEVVVPPKPDALRSWEWYNKGGSLFCLGRYDEAVRSYDRALEIDPRFAAAWNNKGNSFRRLGRHDEAICCYDKALEMDPQDTAAWNNKGNSLHSLGRDEEALRSYDRALALDPRFAAAWSAKGGVLGDLARDEEAIRCYDRALELKPEHANAWHGKGVRLYSLGRYEEAVRCCEKAMEFGPQDGKTWTIMGHSLLHLGRHDEAARCCDKALELDPGLSVAWYSRGILYGEQGRYEEAIGCFDKSLELDPQDEAAWYNKALGEDRIGRRQDAVRSYAQFIAHASAGYSEQVAYAAQRVRELERE
jgi:tetratricopeptide (TPR) repeat protein